LATPSATWKTREPSLAALGLAVSSRLFQRASASWMLWVGAVMLLSTAVTVRRIRYKPPLRTQMVLRLAEGILSPSGDPISTGAIRGHIADLAFSRTHLLEIASRHPTAYPTFESDPVKAVDNLREAIDVDVTENDFLEYRSESDPPRSVRITLGFEHIDPDTSWAVAHELATLLVGSEVERAKQDLTRTVETHTEAVSHADMWNDAPRRRPAGPRPDRTPAQERLREATRQVIAAQLALKSQDENQAFHCEVVDNGRPPRPSRGLGPAITPVLVGLPFLLCAAALLFGAFDPRIVDETDLVDSGLLVLGRLRHRV
jgi:hypothetical protein